MSQEIIRIEGLSKVFGAGDGAVRALDNIDLSIGQGEIFGIIGLSGAGKSTLVRCINLLEKPTCGTVTVDGQNMTALSHSQLLKARQNIGMIFQGFNLLMQRTAEENVRFPLEIAKMPKDKAKQRARELLDIVGLLDRAGAYPAQLSGGQKQRVALARTLVMKPKILLLDEPLSALDGVIKESIKGKIKEIARQLHLTTLIVTHDPEEALTLSDRVLIINQGAISQYAAPQEIINTPKNSFIKEFILSQLEIKRRNIYTLFGESHA